MKTNKHTILHRWAFAILFTLFLPYGCKKFVTLEDPKTQLGATAVFSNPATANAVLANIYGTAGFASGGANSVTYIGLLLADEADNYATSAQLVQLASNQLAATNTYPAGLWQGCYQTIYQSNALIEGVKDNAQLTAQLKNQLRGEALFLRALAHLQLGLFFGSAPLITTTDYRMNTRIPASSLTQLLQAVESDLIEVKQLLPADYSPYAGERIRASKWAATALLARTYLYQNDWEKAESTASELIDGNPLFFLSPLNDAFLKNSKEAIFQLKPTSTSLTTSEGNIFILTGKPTNVALGSGFYTGFESGDQRRENWIGKFTTGGQTYYFPNKYKIKTGTTLSEYSMVLRLGEQYLIRAEARAQLGKTALALADLDALRTRAGLPKLASLSLIPSKSQLLDLVLNERKSELFSEWGHRWIDLRRFGKIDQVLSIAKPGWTSTAALLPIPQADLLVNDQLIQNPGY